MENYGHDELDHDDGSWDADDLLDHAEHEHTDPGYLHDDPLLPDPEHESEGDMIEFLPAEHEPADPIAYEAAGSPHPQAAGHGEAGSWDLPDRLSFEPSEPHFGGYHDPYGHPITTPDVDGTSRDSEGNIRHVPPGTWEGQ